MTHGQAAGLFWEQDSHSRWNSRGPRRVVLVRTILELACPLADCESADLDLALGLILRSRRRSDGNRRKPRRIIRSSAGAGRSVRSHWTACAARASAHAIHPQSMHRGCFRAISQESDNGCYVNFWMETDSGSGLSVPRLHTVPQTSVCLHHETTKLTKSTKSSGSDLKCCVVALRRSLRGSSRFVLA